KPRTKDPALQRRARCIRNEYMSASALITVRIDPQLLAALKKRAQREGRSVSSEVLRMIRNEIEPLPSRRKRRQTTGMFPNFEAPDFIGFKRVRHEFSKAIRGRGRRRTRAA